MLLLCWGGVNKTHLRICKGEDMLLKHQILVIVICYIASFLEIRLFNSGIKRYQLNNSAYKKLKKSETFKEWLFYDKYKELIPKSLLILYFVILFIHPFCIVTCIILDIIELSSFVGKKIAIFIIIFHGIWACVLALMFWRKKPGFAFDRWIKKNKGQKKKK